MRFVVAVAFITGGYTLFYYGVVLFRRYDVNKVKVDGGVPLYVLLGFPSDSKDRTTMDAESPQPPFRK